MVYPPLAFIAISNIILMSRFGGVCNLHSVIRSPLQISAFINVLGKALATKATGSSNLFDTLSVCCSYLLAGTFSLSVALDMYRTYRWLILEDYDVT